MEPVSSQKPIDTFYENVLTTSSWVVKDGRTYRVVPGKDTLKKFWDEFHQLAKENEPSLAEGKWLETLSLLHSLHDETGHTEKAREIQGIFNQNYSDPFHQIKEILFKNIGTSNIHPSLMKCFSAIFESLDAKELKEKLGGTTFNEIEKLHLNQEKKNELFKTLHMMYQHLELLESTLPQKDRAFVSKIQNTLKLLASKFHPDFISSYYGKQFRDISSMTSLYEFLRDCKITLSGDSPLLQKGTYTSHIEEVLDKCTRLIEKASSEQLPPGEPSKEFDAALEVYLKLQYLLKDVPLSSEPSSSKSLQDLLTKLANDPLKKAKWTLVQQLQVSAKKETPDFIAKLFDHLESPDTPFDRDLVHDHFSQAFPDRKERLEVLESLLSTLKYQDASSRAEKELFQILYHEIAQTQSDSLFSEQSSIVNFLDIVNGSNFIPGERAVVLLKDGTKQPVEKVVEFFERCSATNTLKAFVSSETFFKTYPSKLSESLLKAFKDGYLQKASPLAKTKYLLLQKFQTIPSQETSNFLSKVLNFLDNPETPINQIEFHRDMTTVLQKKESFRFFTYLDAQSRALIEKKEQQKGSILFLESLREELSSITQEHRPPLKIIEDLSSSIQKELLQAKSDDIVDYSTSIDTFVELLDECRIEPIDSSGKGPFIILKDGSRQPLQNITTFFTRCFQNIQNTTHEKFAQFLTTSSPVQEEILKEFERSFLTGRDPVAKTKWLFLFQLKSVDAQETKKFISKIFQHLDSPESYFDSSIFHEYFSKVLPLQEREAFFILFEKTLDQLTKEHTPQSKGITNLLRLTREELLQTRSDTLVSTSTSFHDFIEHLEESSYEEGNILRHEPFAVLKNECEQSLETIMDFFKRCLKALPERPSLEDTIFLSKSLSILGRLHESANKSGYQTTFQSPEENIDKAIALIRKSFTLVKEKPLDPVVQAKLDLILSLPNFIYTAPSLSSFLLQTLTPPHDAAIPYEVLGTNPYTSLKNLEELHDSLVHFSKALSTTISSSSEPFRSNLTQISSEIQKTIDSIEAEYVAKKADELFFKENLQDQFKDATNPDILEITFDLFGKHFIVHKEKDARVPSKILKEAQQPLTKGGFKAVHQAQDIKTKTPYALLHLLDREKSEEIKKERDMSKFFLDKKIPGIAKIRLVKVIKGEPLGDLSLVMDLYEKGSLKDFLCTVPPPPLQTRISFAKQIVTSVHGMQGTGKVHADLKTANVLVRGENGKEEANITDFGSCVDVGSPKKPRFMITSGYAAPETMTDAETIIASKELDTWSTRMMMFDLFEPELDDVKGFSYYAARIQDLYLTLGRFAMVERPKDIVATLNALHTSLLRLDKAIALRSQSMGDMCTASINKLENILKTYPTCSLETVKENYMNELKTLLYTLAPTGDPTKGEIIDRELLDHKIWPKLNGEDLQAFAEGLNTLYLHICNRILGRYAFISHKNHLIDKPTFSIAEALYEETDQLSSPEHKENLKTLAEDMWKNLIMTTQDALQQKAHQFPKPPNSDIKEFLASLLELGPIRKPIDKMLEDLNNLELAHTPAEKPK